MRARTLRTALEKRAMKVPTYTVAEAAALLSISTEHLHRLIRANAFPTVPMSDGRTRGCNVIPAKVIEGRLDQASSDGAAGGAR
jgi:excisionase family DNA binding protein